MRCLLRETGLIIDFMRGVIPGVGLRRLDFEPELAVRQIFCSMQRLDTDIPAVSDFSSPAWPPAVSFC